MGGVAPNPMVGAVLVVDGQALAEGWHQRAGGPHAEVMCLERWGEMEVPAEATLYVNLEPCDHQGRTPPCSKLLIERGVKNVVVAHADPYPAVAGKGIARLRTAGVNVTVGVDEGEARWTNRRFLTSVERERPYVILKWAQSTDGFLDKHPRSERGVHRVSDPATDVLVHRWRSEEQAILVGSRTVLNDDPRLDVRHVEGRSPLRVVLDRSARTPSASRVFDGTLPTLLFTSQHRASLDCEQSILPSAPDPLDHMLAELHRRGIRSLLVEGGGELLSHFVRRGLWDEARVITGRVPFGAGTIAPVLPSTKARSFDHAQDVIDLHVNIEHQAPPSISWPWC